MAKAVFDELTAESPKRRFTVGIVDDVSDISLDVDDSFRVDADVRSAVFYALGSDGTVGANKATVKIIGSQPDLYAQGYFVYDSKKSGSMTVSHLRFGESPIRSTYLVQEADLVACHQFGLLDRFDVLENARHGGTFLLNAPFPADEVWDHLPEIIQREIIERELTFFTIDAARVASEVGHGRADQHRDAALLLRALRRDAPRRSPHRDEGLDHEDLRPTRPPDRREEPRRDRPRHSTNSSRCTCPTTSTALHRRPTNSQRHAAVGASEFVERVTMQMMAGKGDLLPVSAMPVDGTFPTGTTRFEKRKLATEIPVWEPDLCIDCGKCAIVCPHAAIRMKAYEPDALDAAPDGFKTKSFRSRELVGHQLTVQVAPDDCTGCGVCVDVCPAKDKTEVKRKSINMRSGDRTPRRRTRAVGLLRDDPRARPHRRHHTTR